MGVSHNPPLSLTFIVLTFSCYLSQEFTITKLSVYYCSTKPTNEQFKSLQFQLTDNTPMGILHLLMEDFDVPFEIPKIKQLVKGPTRGKNIIDLVFW